MSGLEVVGAIASVAQLAGIVYSISKQLYEVANALSNAPSDIKDLAHDLEIFHEELVLHANLLNARNAHYSNQIILLNAKIVGRCAEICAKIDKILRKLRSRSIWANFKWIYKEKEIVKLLTRLKDLKLGLMKVLSLLISAKADHMIDAIGVFRPSVFDCTEDECLSAKTMVEIEVTKQKLAGISIIGDVSGHTTAPHSTTVNKPTPHSLGWTSIQEKLRRYKFVVIKDKEPCFRIISKAALTANTPEIVYLDQHQSTIDGVHPCLYPGGCGGKHSFFETTDLEQHYRMAHGGIDKSHELVSGSGSQSIPAEEADVGIRSSSKPAARSANHSNDSTSGIISPAPIRPMQHQLGAMSSFYSTVSRQASNTDLCGPRQNEGTMKSLLRYTSWSNEMVQSCVKNFGITKEHAESWVLTLPVRPTYKDDPARKSSKLEVDPSHLSRHRLEGTYAQPQGYQETRSMGQPHLLLNAPRKSEKREAKPHPSSPVPSTRRNEYFVPKDGIDREVIMADICRYLGNDATVRPGNYENPATRQTIEGYFFTAYRNLTTAMIADLKADSARWQAERRALTQPSIGQPSKSGALEHKPQQPNDSSRQYYGSTGATQTSASQFQSSSYSSQRPDPSHSRPRSQFQTGSYTSQQSNPSYGRPIDEVEGHIHSPSVSKLTSSPPDPRSDQLWWQAYFLLQEQNPRVSEYLAYRWRTMISWFSAGDLNIEDHEINNRQAHNILILLTLSDDVNLESELQDPNNYQGSAMSSEALNSVKVISNIVEVVKSTVKFKVGSFVWTLFFSSLEPIVTDDQQNSTARSDPILPHMATIATLIARYNVLENIYIEWPGILLDPTLKDSLLRMCVLVLLFIYRLIIYHTSRETSTEEADALRRMEEYMAQIQEADDRCRGFTVRAFDAALPELDSLGNLSDEEEERDALELSGSGQRARNNKRSLGGDIDGIVGGYYEHSIGVDHIGREKAKRVRLL